MAHKTELVQEYGDDFVLKIDVQVPNTDSGDLIISDNAAGIFRHEYARAFRPADVPPDSSGLSEFGMGMKSAACWFGNVLSVESSAIGESVRRNVLMVLSELSAHHETQPT